MGDLHKHLITIVKRLPQDYPPWGTNDRENDPDGWYSDCSCGCKWAAWLEDEPADWLVCTNPKSHRCGLLTFEHQGCPEFEYDEAQEDEMTPVEELLSRLRAVFNEEGVALWLANAIAQGWSMDECLRRVQALQEGVFI